MKNWIISESELTNKHLIASEKAIWLTDQNKSANINELIESQSLGSIESIRYEDLKEIVFVDSDFTIEMNFKEDKATDKEFQLNKNVYSEIRSYLKTNLKGTVLKNYSVLKQIIPQLIVLGVTSILTIVTYISAMELENGETVRIAGRRAWLKKIVVTIAELLGTTGTLIVGVSLIGLLSYFLIKKIQNPKKGEILEITTSPKLNV